MGTRPTLKSVNKEIVKMVGSTTETPFPFLCSTMQHDNENLFNKYYFSFHCQGNFTQKTGKKVQNKWKKKSFFYVNHFAIYIEKLLFAHPFPSDTVN